MPDISNRTDHEESLSIVVYAAMEQALQQGLQDPQTIDWDRHRVEARDRLAEMISIVFGVAVQNMEREYGIRMDNELVSVLAIDYATKRAELVTQNLFDDLKKKVNEAEGIAVNAAALGVDPDDVKAKFDDRIEMIFGKYRAVIIGITETTNAISAGERAVAKPDRDYWLMLLLALFGLEVARRILTRQEEIETGGDRPAAPDPTDQTAPTPAGDQPGGPAPARPAAPDPSPAGDQTGGPDRDLNPTAPPAGGYSDSSGQSWYWRAIWITSNDDRVCPICSPHHNQLESPGTPGNWTELFPNGPAAHPGCRCYLEWRRSIIESICYFARKTWRKIREKIRYLVAGRRKK